jgi:uncharacterized phage protein gp47/JayE
MTGATTVSASTAPDTAAYGVTPQGFIVKPFQAILSDAFTRAQQTFGPDIDLRSSSSIRKIIELVSLDAALLWMSLDDVYHSGFTSTAAGAALDLLGADLGLARASLPATGMATFKLSSLAPQGTLLTLPPGTLVQTGTTNPLYFSLSAALTLSNDPSQPSPAQADAAVTALVTGVSGNIGPNQLTGIQPTFAARYLNFDPSFIAVSNAAAFGGGEAAEDDNTYRRQLQAQHSTNWTPAAVRAAIYAVDGVRDALVKDPYGGLDTSASKFGGVCFSDALFQTPRDVCSPYFFTIVVAAKPGVIWDSAGSGPGQILGLHDQILAALEPIRPISTFPELVQADTVEVSLRARLQLESGADTSGVLAAARTALAAYISGLNLGDPVLFSQTLRLLSELPGVVDVQNLRLRRGPPRFGEAVFGPPAIYGNSDNIAQIEMPCGGNLVLAANEVAVFAGDSNLTQLEFQS